MGKSLAVVIGVGSVTAGALSSESSARRYSRLFGRLCEGID